MTSIREEIMTTANADQVWTALRDIGTLHTQLVPGFAVDTRREPGVRSVSFGNGMIIRKPIVEVDDEARRVVWSAESGKLTHYNSSAQVFAADNGRTKVVWIVDLLKDSAFCEFEYTHG